MFQSELDGIPQIGEKRRVSLLKHFGSISGIKAAGLKELAEVDGMNMKAAESVYLHFHKEEER